MKAYIQNLKENHINFLELIVWSILIYTILFIGFIGLDKFELQVYNLVESFIG